jgi:GNAT superfamily N-acetyltransferase
MVTDDALHARGAATLLASWEEYARGASGASVQHLPGAAAAVFPVGPEREFFNNALVERDLGAEGRSHALDAIAAAYAAAAVTGYAAWVHESDAGMRGDLEQRGWRLVESTRAMGLVLDDVRLPRPAIDVRPAPWSEYLSLADLPAGLLASVDPAAFHVVVAHLDGEAAAAGIAYDAGGDCGIYNVVTREHARRRGLGTVVTTALVRDARSRGCETASLQSTPMAERVYAAVGFRDLGRFLEYSPGPPG